MLPEIEPYFARDYCAARRIFLQAANLAGQNVQTLSHPLTSPRGDPLSTDVVRVGPKNAEKLLVLTSGMHGPELYCGSGVQASLLARGLLDDLPSNMAVLLVHAINPWGSAHIRRVTENNVDPCRNFVDFERLLPRNPDYAFLHPHLGLDGRDEPEGEDARASLNELRRAWGEQRFQCALMQGQYDFPDGFSFGGTEPSWTNQTMSGLLSEEASTASRVATIDFHSGVGPWAYGLAVIVHRGEALERARRWYGEWVLAPNEAGGEDADGYRVTGHSSDGYERTLPDKELTAMVLEFGTYPPERFAKAMTDDHWLQFHGADALNAEHAAIKHELAWIFNPDDAEWRAAVWDRSRQAIRQAMAGLNEGEDN